MPQKSLRAVGIRCWSASEFWSGLGMGSGRGPGRNGGPMMHGPRGSRGGGATPCRAKALGWTGSALDYGGVAVLGLAARAGNAAAKHLARVACQDANLEPKKTPRCS